MSIRKTVTLSLRWASVMIGQCSEAAIDDFHRRKAVAPPERELTRTQLSLERYRVRHLLPGKTNVVGIVNTARTGNFEFCHPVISDTCKQLT
jgi:hypothetical protein